MRPGVLDPALVALMSTEPSQPQQMPPPDPNKGKGMKTGMRRNRSKLQVVMWVLIGVVVIGGGVFAGFQIRRMRLAKQIDEARDNATGLAKTDTYAGWVAARKKLDDIAGVSASTDNRAALARARAPKAYAYMAGVDYARGDVAAAKGDVGAAAQRGIDDQRFAEDAVDTLYLIGDLKAASDIAQTAMTSFPTSRRIHIALAEILLAQGKASDALDLLGKSDVASLPIGQAVRADAKLATGDVDGARADYEAALKKLPNLERAVVGRAWLDIAENNLDEAKKRVESHYSDKGSSAALTTVYAAVLRRTGELDKAKTLLEKVVAGPASPDIARAELELARLDRDTGDLRGARAAYAEASSFAARFESALLLFDARDPEGGREALAARVKAAGDKPPADLLLEAARARTLVGDSAGAKALLDQAEKLGGVQAWKLYRERGRLALRKGQFDDAVAALTKALDSSGDDVETFLLAADASGADAKGQLADKIKKLLPDRLKNHPESKIVEGKLLIAASKLPDALTAYKAAKEALKAEKAPPRRMAQVDYGLAYIASQSQNTVEAQTDFELVMNEDPSIADAYLI